MQGFSSIFHGLDLNGRSNLASKIVWGDSMRLLSIFLGLCVAACGSSVNAAFLSAIANNQGFLIDFTNTVSTIDDGRSVQYTVWLNTTGGAARVTGLTGSPTVTPGSFVYLYQILAPADPAVNSFRVAADPLLVTGAGVVAGQAFRDSPISTRFRADGSLRVTFLNSFSLTDFSIQPRNVNDNENNQSYLMYVVSDYAPTFGEFSVARGRNQDRDVDILSGPVPFGPSPVPLPASLALVGLGLPFVRTLRRKLSR